MTNIQMNDIIFTAARQHNISQEIARAISDRALSLRINETSDLAAVCDWIAGAFESANLNAIT